MQHDYFVDCILNVNTPIAQLWTHLDIYMQQQEPYQPLGTQSGKCSILHR